MLIFFNGCLKFVPIQTWNEWIYANEPETDWPQCRRRTRSTSSVCNWENVEHKMQENKILRLRELFRKIQHQQHHPAGLMASQSTIWRKVQRPYQQMETPNQREEPGSQRITDILELMRWISWSKPSSPQSLQHHIYWQRFINFTFRFPKNVKEKAKKTPKQSTKVGPSTKHYGSQSCGSKGFFHFRTKHHTYNLNISTKKNRKSSWFPNNKIRFC